MFFRRRTLLLLVSLGFFAGCWGGVKVDPPADPQAAISTLGRLYGEFALKNKRGPKDEAEFKQYITSLSEPSRAARGITNVDQVFTSPRDGLPFVVRYGLQGSGGNEKNPDWNSVVQEKDGKDGTRWGASENGTVTDMAKAAGS